MKPRWMRQHIACPDCGYILKDEDDGFKRNPKWSLDTDHKERVNIAWDCTKCKAHYEIEDFWNEQHEKWDRTMKEA